MDFKIAIALQLIDNFSRQLFELKENVSRFNHELQQTQNKLKSFQETLRKAFDPKALWEFSERFEDFTAKMAQATALPLAGFTKAIHSFSEMEQARVEMEVAFMTKEGLPKQIEELNKQIEELGVRLPGSATDFYRVATALKSAGMDIEKIVGGGLKAASYAWVLFKREASPEQVAEYMQQFANAFKIPAEGFSAFVDQLQRLKFASGLELSEIAYSTKYFSSELNQLGVTGLNASKIMFAWIGTLKQFGIKGETAGTSIRSVLQNISKLEENLSKLQKKEGIDLQISVKDFFDERGAFQLEKFLITIRERLSAIQDPLLRMKILTTLFDAEGMRAIVPLLVKSKEEALAYLETIKNTLKPEEYTALREQIKEGGFSGLEEMAKKMEEQASLQQRINVTLQTFANVWESLQGTLTQVAAIFGSLVAPGLIKIFNFLNNVLGKVADFINEHKTLSAVFAYTIGGFVSLLAVVGTFSLVLGTALKLLSLAFTSALWLMRINLVKNLTGALLQNSIAFLKWIITGQAGITWLKTFDFWLLKVKFSILQAVSALKAKTTALLHFMGVMARYVWASFLSGLRALISGFRSAVVAVRAFSLALITNPIFLIITGIVALITAGYLVYKHWDKISKALSGVWNWLKANWKKVLEVFLYVNPITAPIMALRKLVQYVMGIDLFVAGKKIIESLWEGIKTVATKPIEEVKNIVQKIRNLLPSSPAKEGPLSDLHRIKFIETIAEAIKPSPLLIAMKQVLEPVRAFTQPLIQPVKQVLEPVKPAGATFTGPTIHIGSIQFVIHGTITEKEKETIATDLRNIIERTLQRINYERERRRY